MIRCCERNVNVMSGDRFWAAAALVVAIATIVFAIDVALSRIPKGLCVVVAVAAAAYGLMRRGAARIIALVVAVLLLATSITLVFVEHDPSDDVLIAVGVMVVLAAARRAFRARVEWPRRSVPPIPCCLQPAFGRRQGRAFCLGRGRAQPRDRADRTAAE